MADYSFYNKRQYFKVLVDRFQSAGPGSRILLMSMTFEPDEPEIEKILHALESAAQRGADIRFSVDARCFLDNNGKPGPDWRHTSKLGPLWFYKQLPAKVWQPYELKQNWIKRLQAYPNVHSTVMNKPRQRFSLPIAGRSHIKAAIIDDQIILGSSNLDNPADIDQVITWHDNDTANKLYAQLAGAIDNGNVRQEFKDNDQTIVLDEKTEILIDAGVPGQSDIFDKAIKLIDSAEDWLLLTCQYFPNGPTAERLAAAQQRGVKVDVIYSNLAQYIPVRRNVEKINRLIERRRIPRELFAGELSADTPYIHAKTIACDKGLIIGSHNYVTPGVRLGTAEIAFKTSDAILAAQAKTALLGYI